MISSILGAIIMSAATVAMLVTLQFTNKVKKEVGRDNLTRDELNILKEAELNKASDLEKIRQAINDLPYTKLD